MANTTLYPTADSYVNESQPDTNYGTATTLYVRTDLGINIRSFLKFDISGLPVGATITLAKLRMNCFAVYDLSSPDSDVQARRVADDSWLEVDPDGIDWNNQPAFGVVEDTQVPAVGWVEWTVTPFVVAEFAGDQTVSVCLKCVTEDSDPTTRQSNYRSKEYNAEDPELYIEYTTGIKIPVAMHHYNRINKIIRG